MPEPLAIVQARLTGTRLPNKVLAHLAGVPLVEHVYRRTADACTAVVAIPDTLANDPLAEFLMGRDIPFMRGPEFDVLGRYWRAADLFGGDPIVRITADDPFKDPDLIRMALRCYDDQSANLVELENFPIGMDVEVFSRDLLEKAAAQATAPEDREHVLPWIRRHAAFRRPLKLLKFPDRSAWRWTIDTAADLRFARAVYDRLYADDPLFGFPAVLGLIEMDSDLLDLMFHEEAA